MSETTETPTPRTFYRTDYAKNARLIKNMRHVRCQPSTPKDEARMAKVDYLADLVAQQFMLDAPEGAFSAEKFMAGTQLPSYGNGYDEQADADTE